MINGVEGTTSILQIKRAEQAFKNAAKYSTNDLENNNNVDDSNVNISLKPNYSAVNSNQSSSSATIDFAQKSEYINEIKNFASKNGYSEISDDEISYAIKYGRSILVDQSA